MESNVNGGEDIESIIEHGSNEDTRNCDHFSIRAYVAEIRKRDWKICWPFGSSFEFYKDKDCEGNVDMTSYEYLPLIDLVKRENSSSVMSNTKIRPNASAYRKMDKNVEKTADAETRSLDVGAPNCGILDLEFGEKQSNECFRSMEILKHKRPQKVRLLSDILRGEISGGSFDLSSSNGNVKSDNMETRITDTEAADDSDHLTLDTLFRSRKVNQPNAGKIDEFRNNKKRPQVEDVGPGQSRWSNGESEVSWCRNSNKENTSAQSVIGSSESVKTDFSRDVAFVSRAEKRQRKFSFEGRQSFLKMPQENLCQELLLMSTDPESKDTRFHLPNDAPRGSNLLKSNVVGSHDFDRKSISCLKESYDKGSLMPPYDFVPMKKGVGRKNVNIDPYFVASNKGSDSSSRLKNNHGAFKRKKGSSFSSNSEKNIVVQANSEITEIPSSELDGLDDISMEIVKLLAENRREKLLLEAEAVNRVENPRKVQPTRASDSIISTDFRKNTLQVQRKPFKVGGDTFDEITPLGIEIAPQGRDPHKVCFPYVVNKTSSPKQRKPFDVDIYSKKTAEKPCACVQKKIRMSQKLDSSLTTYSNEQRQFTFGETMFHIRSTERNIDSTRIGGTRGQVSGDIVSGSVKSCKNDKLKSSVAAMEAMNGHDSGKNTLGSSSQSFSFSKVQSSALGHIVLPVEPNMVKGNVVLAEVMKKKKRGAAAWAVKGGEICSVNRNPADFSIPGTGNKFMRRGRSENSRKGEPKPTIGKMAGSMKGINIPTCVA